MRMIENEYQDSFIMTHNTSFIFYRETIFPVHYSVVLNDIMLRPIDLPVITATSFAGALAVETTMETSSGETPRVKDPTTLTGLVAANDMFTFNVMNKLSKLDESVIIDAFSANAAVTGGYN